MAIKVQWEADGPFAICDSPAEAMELLRHARLSANGVVQPSKQPKAVMPDAPRQSTDDKVDSIVAGINAKAKRLLNALLNYPQGIEGEDFGKVCGTEPAGFGGVLGGISKKAKEVGLTVDDLVQSEARFEGDRRYRWLAPTKLLLEHKHRLHDA